MRIKEHKSGIVIILYALLQATLIYYCLELGNKNPFLNGVLYTVINILTIFVIMSAVFLIVQRWWISSLVVGIPFAVLSIANYYTLAYRNSPISTQDIHNFGTTLSVIESYKFPINVFVIGIIVFFALQIAVVAQLYKREKVRKLTFKSKILKNLVLVLCGWGFLHLVYFAENPIKQRDTFVFRTR